MSTLFVGFIGIVLVPALIIAAIMNMCVKKAAARAMREENMKFTISMHMK